MSTIAEKIKRLDHDINVVCATIDEMKKELESLKPADPEPLECWGNVYNDFRHNQFHKTYNIAVENAGRNAIRRGVYMREVTPQDEQDREDAARYRLYKKLAIFDVSWRQVDTIRNLDEHLDKER